MLDALTYDSNLYVCIFASCFPPAAHGLLPPKTLEVESFSYRGHWPGQGVYVELLGASMDL